MQTLSGNLVTYVNVATGELIRRVRSCSIGYLYCPANKSCVALFCKRRLCEFCGHLWSQRWCYALKLKAENDVVLSQYGCKLVLTLTFAQLVDFKVMQRVLREFWRLVRVEYPSIGYWGVVEFNQKHSQPHLHFVLSGVDFVPYQFLRRIWQIAQRRAGIEKIAFVLRVEEIRKGVAAYFTKYVTKLVGGKDEIPRRQLWAGRYVRYSRNFFPVPISAMLAAHRFETLLKAGEQLKRFVTYINKPRQFLGKWQSDSEKDEIIIADAIARDWSPIADVKRGVLVTASLNARAWLDETALVNLTSIADLC